MPEIGQTISHYRILEKIGAGGMGEVYRAFDVRLERDVAVKVLPAHLAEDPTALARFEREVKVIAALSHPNILGIFDVGSEGGIAYAVTELLEGETLRERLQGGALPVRRAVDCATQIARGLAAAHDKGLVHRDLKPENIFLLKDGQVKILDFGLARTVAPKDSEETASAALTSPGTVMGTAGYMSPEQVRGLQVDHRSDIFNFGLILHELLSGARAFHGETSVDTMQAILRADPPELPETVPGGLCQIAGHCLEKDPANRFQSARDLGFALAALSQNGSQAAAKPVQGGRSPWLRRGVVALGLAAIVVATVLLTRWFSHTPAAPEWEGKLLSGPEISWGPRISPDGNMLAFQTMVDGQSQVAWMKPDSADYKVLTDKSNRGLVMEICWNLDGSRIYYDRFNKVPSGIYSVPVTGGTERLECENAIYPQILPDDSLLGTHINNANGKLQVFQFWPSTNETREFAVEVLIGNMPYRVFPDGREAIVSGTLIDPARADGQHLYIIELSTGNLRRLAPGLPKKDEPRGALAVTKDAVLAVQALGAFYRVMAIPRGGGAPVPTLLSFTKQVWFLDTAWDGSIYLDQGEGPLNWLHFPITGGIPERLGQFPFVSSTGYAIAGTFIGSLPDGRAVLPIPTGDSTSLRVIENKGKGGYSLAGGLEPTAPPIAIAGTDQVACLIGGDTNRAIALINTTDRSITRRISFNKGNITSLASSPNGQILYCAADGNIWKIPVSGGSQTAIRQGKFVAADRDGRFLIVQAVEASGSHLYRVPLDAGQEKEIPLNGPFGLNAQCGINSQALRDNRLLVSLTLPNSWYLAPGWVDIMTGRMTRIPLDYVGDIQYLGWTDNGQVVAAGQDFRSTLWKLQPQSRKD